MFVSICTVDFSSTNSTSKVGIIEIVKFNHDLDTIFWGFWAESVQCALVLHFLKSGKI